jgi:hypothetical protein
MRVRCRVSRPFAIRLLLAGLFALLLPSAAAVERGTEVRLIDLDPGQNAILRSGEPLYLRLHYRSAVPIHILVSGRYHGDLVQGHREDSEELFPAGNREATVWLAYPFDARIDEVKVRIWNVDKEVVTAAVLPIDAEWSDANEPGAGVERLTKSWVADLTPTQRERMTAPGFDEVDLFVWGVPGYFLLQVVLTLCTSGGWRLATLAPAVIMVPVLAYTVLAYGQSNLWPLLLIFTAPWAALYLIVLTVILLLSRLARTA